MTTALALPSTEEEIWRYSRINELDMSKFASGKLTTTVDGGEGVQLNGAAATALVGAGMHVQPDVFAQLNTDTPDVIALHIGKNKVHTQTVVITHSVDKSGVVAYPRLVIDAAENSEIVVVERFTSADNVHSLVVPVVEVHAAQSARVTYLAINELGKNTWQIGHQVAVGERDSNVRLFTVALGGDYARMRAEVRLVGQGASAQQTALYFADGNQMHDFRTLQDHAAPRTHSDLLFKGVVRDTAKSVYTGLIKIRENADKSEAFQTNRSLTLSSGAWAESVPNLEIETGKIEGAGHASASGRFDDEQLFYLQARGLTESESRRLVVRGFLNEIIQQIGVPEVESRLIESIEQELERGRE